MKQLGQMEWQQVMFMLAIARVLLLMKGQQQAEKRLFAVHQIYVTQL
jgi:hypothetical protein